jgi:hypothetical protein
MEVVMPPILLLERMRRIRALVLLRIAIANR